MTTAADLWLQHQTDVAEVDGEPVFAALTLDLDGPTSLTITRIAVTPDRPQGLMLDADDSIVVDSLAADSIVLWSDTAPATATLLAPAGRLTISNLWRDGDIVHAWTGWAGIVREPGDGVPELVRISASDGHAPMRADLEIEIRFAPLT